MLYNIYVNQLVMHAYEKYLKKILEYIWRIYGFALLLHPLSRTKEMKQEFFEKFI